MFPQCFQTLGQRREVGQLRWWRRRLRAVMVSDPLFDLTHPGERLVPAPFELIGNKSILRIGRIVLPLRSRSGVACCLEITLECP